MAGCVLFFCLFLLPLSFATRRTRPLGDGKAGANSRQRIGSGCRSWKAENGLWQGSIIIPGLNLPATQLVDIAVQDSDASFENQKTGRGLDAAFKGHCNADGTLSGDFMPAGNRAGALSQENRSTPGGSAYSRHASNKGNRGQVERRI